MLGVLKTILFLVVFYYVWKLLFRLFFPIVLKKAMNKAQQNMEERMRNAQAQQTDDRYTQQEGEVIIQKGAVRHQKKGAVAEDEGEYVDFEEIRE